MVQNSLINGSQFSLDAVSGNRQLISKSYEREARDRLEISSTATPSLVRHEVQLQVNL